MVTAGGDCRRKSPGAFCRHRRFPTLETTRLCVPMTDEEITKLLFCCDEPCSADLAMVFGAANELDLARRTKRGVELYRSGLVPRLLVTGGGVLARTRPETKRMAEIARELGVPTPDLLVEDLSANTFENVNFSIALLDNHGLLEHLASVILVSSEWHMRRVLLTVQASFSRPIRFICCPTREGCNRQNWTASEVCRNEVLNEAMLLEAFLETGALRSATEGTFGRMTISSVAIGPMNNDASHHSKPLRPFDWAKPALMSDKVPQPTKNPGSFMVWSLT